MPILVTPSHAALDPSDDRFLAQVNDLLADLKACGGQVERRVTPVPGRKGGLEEILLALGTSGAITAAVEIIKAWLARDRNRSLVVGVDHEGKKETFSVTGTVDKATLVQFMEKALQR
jgi:hypothetical protein